MNKCRVLGVVPVRLGSTRLPGKALLPAGDCPLFVHVARALVEAASVDQVVVATDAPEVMQACAELGIAAMLTATSHRTGSERCREVAEKWDCELVIDAQGDWPEILPADLDGLVADMFARSWPLGTLVKPTTDREAMASPHVVKVVGDQQRRALYFSRCPIPYAPPETDVSRLRHIGVYAFSRSVLLNLPALPPCEAATLESLEQLRFLHGGVEIGLVAAAGDPWGIETEADYQAFLKRLGKQDH